MLVLFFIFQKYQDQHKDIVDAYNEALAKWRLETPPSVQLEVNRRLKAAGHRTIKKWGKDSKLKRPSSPHSVMPQHHC